LCWIADITIRYVSSGYFLERRHVRLWPKAERHAEGDADETAHFFDAPHAALVLALSLAWLMPTLARPHDIYTGVYGKDWQPCCGGEDCSATRYRERGGSFEFLTRENEWIAIPNDRITFVPVPGDPRSDGNDRAHLCYRAATQSDRMTFAASNVFG
jgi:hypothetical protein